MNEKHELPATEPVVRIESDAGFEMGGQNSKVFAAKLQQIGQKLGLQLLGCMCITVQPGKRAFPFHNHLGNDEMFVILAGSGKYRFGEKEYAVSQWDVCGAPRGGPNTAHQLINDSDVELIYLAISTNNDPDVMEYPDSRKFAALAISPGADFGHAHLKFIGRVEESLDYFDGEAE